MKKKQKNPFFDNQNQNHFFRIATKTRKRCGGKKGENKRKVLKRSTH